MAIEVGQSVSFPFAGKSMQGTVVRVHDKTVVLRADFRFLESWEGMIEGRTLQMPDLHDSRRGSVLAG